MLRFYDPISGEIYIDGKNIKEIDLGILRKNIGYVHQDVFIFNETFKNNISYGNPTASMDKIIEAAQIAQIHEYINSLPDKYNSLISENGANLSGGQKQRLSIARTLLLDPPILILDDSTSSVDATTEKDIQKAINKLISGRTVITIAHKLYNFQQSSNIAVIDKGEITEYGSHEHLINSNGIYKKIYELQTTN